MPLSNAQIGQQRGDDIGEQGYDIQADYDRFNFDKILNLARDWENRLATQAK